PGEARQGRPPVCFGTPAGRGLPIVPEEPARKEKAGRSNKKSGRVPPSPLEKPWHAGAAGGKVRSHTTRALWRTAPMAFSLLPRATKFFDLFAEPAALLTRA